MKNMGSAGVLKFDWMKPGPRGKKKSLNQVAPDNFEPETSRAPMGRRPAPYVHKVNSEAASRRREREAAPMSAAIIRSQLIVARKRLREGVENPARGEVFAAFPRRNGAYRVGDQVRYIRPGPRRNRYAQTGVLLAVPDRKGEFCAIDRSQGAQKRRRLDHIDVVPAADVWAAE